MAVLAPWGAALLAERDGPVLTIIPNGGDLAVLAGGALAAALVAGAVPALRAARASIETVLKA